MGHVRDQAPKVMLVFAAFTHSERLLDEVLLLLAEHYSPVWFQSDRYRFEHTDYYRRTMGEVIHKQFFACEGLHAADCLADWKLLANELEQRIAGRGDWPVERPLNLDPGSLDAGKLILATTKDHAHRIYLRDGIFAEVTLHFRDLAWRHWPWTFADYRSALATDFFLRVRKEYTKLLKER